MGYSAALTALIPPNARRLFLPVPTVGGQKPCYHCPPSSSPTLGCQVDGEKLSESRAADVRTLCTTLLNAYLIQLMDTGNLHADPWVAAG